MSKRFAPIGTATAPSADTLPSSYTADADATAPRDHDATEDRPAVPGRVRRATAGGRAPAPQTDTAVAMSARVEPDEAIEIDGYVLSLRGELGYKVDKAEVIRALLRLARTNPPVHRALVKQLR